MSFIHSVVTRFPKYYSSQTDIAAEISRLWPERKRQVEQFHQSSLVKGRHLTLPLERYKTLGDIGERSKFWLETAQELQKQNIVELLSSSGLKPTDISLIVSTTVTGLAIPSLEARLMNLLPFSSSTKRIPIFGLGCLGGVAGINRVNDYLKGHPKEAALLLATELCTLTFQFQDQSVANLVGTSLFGDGAAAVLLVGDEHPLASKAKFEVESGQSFFYPQTEHIMGWEMVASGFQIVLSGDVPKIVEREIPNNLNQFLSNQKMCSSDISFIVSHPGGPKVLEKLTEVTGKNKEDFQLSWDSLAEKGNMSSVSVLHVLEQTCKKPLRENQRGLMVAMGPAFCSEMALIKRVRN